MKLRGGMAFLACVGMLLIATVSLTHASDAVKADARLPFAHIAVAPRAVGFGMARQISSKMIVVRSTGTIPANVSVAITSQSSGSPFSVTFGGGGYTLVPLQPQGIEIQFAPTAPGRVTATLEITCSNCNTKADQDIVVHLAGNAREALATPAPTATATATQTAIATATATSTSVPVATPTSTATSTLAPTATATVTATGTPTTTATRTSTATATPTATATSTSVPGANALGFSITKGPSGSLAFSPDVGFASITVCATGTSNCTTVNHIAVDSGSTGVRIFGSQLAGLGITPNSNLGQQIGECAFFGSGSTWGSVATVDLKIAGEPTITIPIQVIDDQGAFASAPTDCTQGSALMSSPAAADFNGLLGVGQLANDQPTLFTDYFQCLSGSCTSLQSPPNADIVVNPVTSFPIDNNGFVVSLPQVPAGGAANFNGTSPVNGTVYFGICTQSNNRPGAVTVLKQDSNPNDLEFLGINTIYQGSSQVSFFDTGSNGIFFNTGHTVPNCPAGTSSQGFYCPTSALALSATNEGIDGSTSSQVNFAVQNAQTLLQSGNLALNDIAGPFDSDANYDGFDWGMPFFLGRTVFFGIQGTSSCLGADTFTAY